MTTNGPFGGPLDDNNEDRGSYNGGSWTSSEGQGPPTGPVTPGQEPVDPWTEEGEQVPAPTGPSGRSTGWPIPSRTWTTKNGSQVTVAGCCLPFPLLATALSVGVVAARARLRRGE